MFDVFDNLHIHDWVNAAEGDWHIWWNDHVMKHTTVINAPEFGEFVFCRYWCNTPDFQEAVKIQQAWKELTVVWQCNTWGKEKVAAIWPPHVIAMSEHNWNSGLYNKYLHGTDKSSNIRS